MNTDANPRPQDESGPPTIIEVAAWLRLFIEPDAQVEIRAPKYKPPGSPRESNPHRRFSGRNLLGAAKEGLRLSEGAPGVYWTLNPVKPGLAQEKAAGDADIERRRLILIDCDPVREIDEPGDFSSTNAEKAAAHETMLAVGKRLMALGWPAPVVADSGNGYHLLYRVELPADDAGLVKAVLEALAARFDSEACTIDKKVYNSSRICKLYGTVARKGENTAERPHRISRVLKAPEPFDPVPVELLQAVAADKPAAAPALDLEAEIERKRERAAAASHPPNGKPRSPSNGARPDPERRALAYLQKCEPAVSGSNGHSQAFKTACKVGPGFDLTPDAALRLLAVEYNPRCVPPWSERELKHKVDEAYKVESRRGWLLDADGRGGKSNPPGSAAPLPPDGSEKGRPRREIEIDTERHRALAETLATLPADPNLYRRGNVLVAVAPETEDETDRKGKSEPRQLRGAVRVVPLAESGLSCRLTSVADFYGWRIKGKGESAAEPAHPPVWLTRAILEHGAYPGVRELRGVAEAPFPRPDGSLVTRPGYDRATAFYLAPGLSLDDLPERPTQDDAKAAARTLLGVVEQFPFATDDDRAVWLAGLLTVIARPAIDGPVPGVVMNSNRAGTGKGKLIDAVGCIAFGPPIPCTTYPEQTEEAGKLKVALALSATPVVHLDNLDEGKSYGKGALDSALTSMQVNDRVLGVSKLTEGLELSCCWFLSGNNLTPAKDAYRRWLVCNLSTELERPEERDDLKILDLLAHVRGRRAELVRAALVVLLAHSTAGRPTGGWAPLGSFEQWDRVVRGAVWYATGWDCNTTRRQSAEESPERQDRLALMEAWAELPNGGHDGNGLTSEEAIRLATQEAPSHPDLVTALSRFCRDGKAPTPRGIGMTLSAMKGRNIDGMAFRVRKHHKRSALWHVVNVFPNRPSQRNSDRQSGNDSESSECSNSLSPHTQKGKDSYSDVMAHEKERKTTEEWGERESSVTPHSPPRSANPVVSYTEPGYENPF